MWKVYESGDRVTVIDSFYLSVIKVGIKCKGMWDKNNTTGRNRNTGVKQVWNVALIFVYISGVQDKVKRLCKCKIGLSIYMYV